MLSVSDGKIQVIAKPRVKNISLTFISDQIEGVCYSIGELLIFDLQKNISSVSELGSTGLSKCEPSERSLNRQTMIFII